MIFFALKIREMEKKISSSRRRSSPFKDKVFECYDTIRLALCGSRENHVLRTAHTPT